jgi:hypothetical protein
MLCDWWLYVIGGFMRADDEFMNVMIPSRFDNHSKSELAALHAQDEARWGRQKAFPRFLEELVLAAFQLKFEADERC